MDEFFRQAVKELVEQVFVGVGLQLRLFPVHGHEPVKGVRIEIKAVPTDIVVAGHKPHRAFDSVTAALGAVEGSLDGRLGEFIGRCRLFRRPEENQTEDHIGHGPQKDSHRQQHDADETNPAQQGEVAKGLHEAIEITGQLR